MTFFSPMAFLSLITIPAIIFLYLLKQRSQDLTVSSLYLWEEVLKDLEANAPWQKLKKNLLLILQLLAMLLLIFALSRPFLNTPSGKAGSTIVILDNSLSMQATDVKPSRLELAKKQAEDYVYNLQPGTLVSLVSMGTRPVIEENLNKDRNAVIDKIKKLEATNGVSNYEDASTLVQSMAKQQEGTEVVLFGDNSLEVPGVEVKFSRVSQNGFNYAITLLSHTRTRNGITVLSRISNFSGSGASIPLSLYGDGKVLDAKNVEVAPGETSNVYWSGIPENTQQLECRIDAKDSLDADNRAWNTVNPSLNAKVMLVSEKNVFIEKALSLSGNVELYKSTPLDIKELKGYSLYIFDGFLPEALPSDGNIVLFNPPENKFFTVGSEVELPKIEKSKHELFNYIEDYSFSIGKTRLLTVPKWGEPVLEASEGTLAFTGMLDNKRILVFGFDIHNTDMPLKPVFPILMTSIINSLAPSGTKNVENAFPGQGIEFNLDPKTEQAKVISPSGKVSKIAPPFPAELFDATGEVGLYTLEQAVKEDRSYHYFTVNAPAERESNLLKGENTVQNQAGDPGKAAGKVSTGFNLQGLILWAAILLLLIEWWVYSNGV